MEDLTAYLNGGRYNSNILGASSTIGLKDAMALKEVVVMTETMDSLKASATFAEFLEANHCIAEYYKVSLNSAQAFYAIKTGYIITGVPPQATSIIKDAYLKSGKKKEDILKYIDKDLLQVFFTCGYLKHGVTLEQVIKYVCSVEG